MRSSLPDSNRTTVTFDENVMTKSWRFEQVPFTSCALRLECFCFEVLGISVRVWTPRPVRRSVHSTPSPPLWHPSPADLAPWKLTTNGNTTTPPPSLLAREALNEDNYPDLRRIDNQAKTWQTIHCSALQIKRQRFPVIQNVRSFSWPLIANVFVRRKSLNIVNTSHFPDSIHFLRVSAGNNSSVSPHLRRFRIPMHSC